MARKVKISRMLTAPLAGQVHRPRKQLFACAGLSQQQHRGQRFSHALQFVQGLQQRGGRADDAVAGGGGLQRLGQQLVFGLQGAGFLQHQRLQLQQLPSQRGQNSQHRHVVIELAVPAANTVAGQHADHFPVDLDRQRNEGHHLLRQLAAGHAARIKNCGSVSMSCTMMGCAVASTRPVMPSPGP